MRLNIMYMKKISMQTDYVLRYIKVAIIISDKNELFSHQKVSRSKDITSKNPFPFL